jgi:hypothetical protein
MPGGRRAVTGDRRTGGHLLRRLTVGSGPLKRGSDRLELLARVLLVCSLVTAIPVALAVGTATHTRAQAVADAQAAERHRVPAILLQVDPPASGEALASANRAQGTAVWTDPAGNERRGTVSVPAEALAGIHVDVWIDRDGDRTPPPLSDSDIIGRAVSEGSATFFGLAVVAIGAYLAVRLLLDRSRSRRWAAEWAAVEPVWRRMVT